MKRRGNSVDRAGAAGFTLIEVLVATALTLILMAAVVEMFRRVSGGMSDARATLEMSDRLRSTAQLLQRDLGGVTATMLPPQSPEKSEGYFEIVEGINSFAGWDNIAGLADTTVGDVDDILMFTTRRTDQPFAGRFNGGTVQSDVAEVAWFMRGNTLYRRVLLVAPRANVGGQVAAGFFNNNDISVRMVNNALVANSLSDLTKRECRFGHYGNFPYDVRGWGQLGLPLLQECSASGWTAGQTCPGNGVTIPPTVAQIDMWRSPHPWTNVDKSTGALTAFNGPRMAEDVVLAQVIGFDVKVWEPQMNAYVDLGYGGSAYVPPSATNPPTLPSGQSPTPWLCFNHLGAPKSGLVGSNTLARVYDTYSTHYESDPLAVGAGNVGKGSNGVDDDNNGLVDDFGEAATSPPYPAPLRGIQVKIRAFDPDSRQIREITVVQDFLPK